MKTSAVSVGKHIRRMRKTRLIALALLTLAACVQEDSTETPQRSESIQGRTVVFRSNVGPAVVALHLDEGAYRNYADVSDVRGPSDIGGELEPCGFGVSKCVAFSGLYVMAPPPDESGWFLGGYDFRMVGSPSDGQGAAIFVSRYGEESYSYGYRPRCGVEWINFSTGGRQGKEVFFPVGPSLFSEPACAPSPDS